MDWFTVDKNGLAKTLEGRGKDRVLTELVQNAWDEDGVTEVHVTLHEHERRGRAIFTVSDDAPDGFKDLSHAYTMFAPSGKVGNAEKRGRFNLGEKLFLAICDEATILSTTGGWQFDDLGRHRLKGKRPVGSIIEATVRLTKPERASALEWLEKLIVPEGIATYVNGIALTTRTPVRSFTVQLPTQIADDEGVLRPTRRNTTVRLFEPLLDEQPYIYEMGIPVVEHDGRWHVDVGQKVPLNMDRDNVTPAYLRELRVHVLNAGHDLIEEETARGAWVTDAIGDRRITPEAITTVVEQRYGDKAVIRDMSDQEANKEAVLKGYTVVSGGAFNRDAWQNIRQAGALLPAGQVTPSHGRIEMEAKDPESDTSTIPESEWTPGMRTAADYAQRLAKDVLGKHICVEIVRTMKGVLAYYGGERLALNLQWLGHRWFNDLDQQKVDELYLHEFAHDRVSDHLSEAFHHELCRLGALLRNSDARL